MQLDLPWCTREILPYGPSGVNSMDLRANHKGRKMEGPLHGKFPHICI